MSRSRPLYQGISLNNRKDFRGEHYLIEHVLRHHLDPEQRRQVSIIWPYLSRKAEWTILARYAARRLLLRKSHDIFITHENVPPRWALAPYQIGFHNDIDHPRYFRFPNWQLHLNWSELHTQPIHNRYGTRLDIDQLMRPIRDTWGDDDRIHQAVMFSAHRREPRGSLYQAVDRVLGCHGVGKAFSRDTRLKGGKYDLSLQFRFALCPENSIGPGYLTEKIPEAFYAGCVPISWCRPQDLAVDFNPKAVVNLYGLSNAERTGLLRRLAEDRDYVEQLRSEPLLRERPSLGPLIAFLKQASGCRQPVVPPPIVGD